MDIYTLDRGFQKQDVIDDYSSVIWVERFYGNGDFELSFPVNSVANSKLPKGQLVLCDESTQPMILETRDIEEGMCKATGITLTQWLNNRILRTSDDHTVREYRPTTFKPGEVLVHLVSIMCIEGSTFLNGMVDIGIDPSLTELFSIPGLVIGTTDEEGVDIDIAIPFGPLYDALKAIGETYEIGMRIDLDFATDDDYQISYNIYRGENRTSSQSVNPVIRFSPDMESLNNVKELESLTDHRNFIFVFAPGTPSGFATGVGFDFNTPGSPANGFDLRVFQGFADDITSETVGGSPATLLNVLTQRATTELKAHKIVQLVDGELVQTGQINFNEDYFLGDIIEVEGHSGVIQHARITEYIRSKDSSGERKYPTLTFLE